MLCIQESNERVPSGQDKWEAADMGIAEPCTEN